MTGKLTVAAPFACSNQEVYTHVNSIGWLRVIDTPWEYGSVVRILIAKRGETTPSELHGITLTCLDNGPIFQEEYSKSDGFIITKIRYTNAGKVDIYIDQNYSSDIGIKIVNLSSTLTKTDAIKTITPSSVASAPPGETVLTTYNFCANSEVETTPQSGTYSTNILNFI